MSGFSEPRPHAARLPRCKITLACAPLAERRLVSLRVELPVSESLMSLAESLGVTANHGPQINSFRCSKMRSGHVGHVAVRLQSQNAASSDPVDGEAERLQSSQWAANQLVMKSPVNSQQRWSKHVRASLSLAE